jgi:microcystin synthetase protein McyA
MRACQTDEIRVNRCDPCDVVSRFEHQVKTQPQATALIAGDSRWSYHQLNALAGQLAQRLLTMGVGPEVSVAVCLTRTADLVATFLAVLKSGGAYVPLDTDTPDERLAYMLKNSTSRVLIATRDLSISVPSGIQVIYLDEPQDTEIRANCAAIECPDNLSQCEPDQLAYTIYTSGSTGKPKGVQISRRSLSNALECFSNEFRVTSQDVFLSITGISFDIFELELYLPLCTGACLVLADRKRLLEIDYLANLAERYGATLFQATPSLCHNLIDSGWRPRTEMRMLVGGEAMTANLAEYLQANDLTTWNVYGPTEATIWASSYSLSLHTTGTPAIGRPVWNTELHVLSERLDELPVGVTGELYIGGAQLARGYAGRPDLTAERFLPNPFVPGECLYRTGDLARWRPDGELEYLGRADRQIKIRGHRIEPGEIETVLSSHQAVETSAVMVRQDQPGDQQLVAYFSTSAAWRRQSADASLIIKQTSAWQEIYDSRYEQGAGKPDEFDSEVWQDSRTGQPYSDSLMREWVDATLARIAAFKAKRILEVGCGSGLLMLPMASGTERYVGTDISGKALELLARDTLAIPQVELIQTQANQIAQLGLSNFDLIILNSVVQYFPSVSYLLEVLNQCFELLAPEGRIFIGDIRHLGLLDSFYATIELNQADAELSQSELRGRVAQRRELEAELCLHPSFFASLNGYCPVQKVQVLAKHGLGNTEMNNFRYDAILQREYAEDPTALTDMRTLHWRSEEWSLVHLQGLLEGGSPARFKIIGIPDQRVLPAIQLLTAQGPTPLTGVHPEVVWAIAEHAGYSATLRATQDDGTFDAVFAPLPCSGEALALYEVVANSPNIESLASNPLRNEANRLLRADLHAHLCRLLPVYMVPSFLILLDSLPLTINGKLDRNALPVPNRQLALHEASSPRDPLEAGVAKLMGEVLGLARPPGLDVSFFKLGGNSLSAARLTAKLRQAFNVEVSLKSVFETPSVAGLAASVRAATIDSAPDLLALGHGPGELTYMSHAQERLWFLDRLEESSALYNMAFAIRLDGPLSVEALQFSLTELVRRHTVLRTVYVEKSDGPRAVSQATQPFPLKFVDLSGLEATEAEAGVAEWIATDSGQPFDLSHDLMLRARLLRVSENVHALIVVAHHIAVDGLSTHVMWSEIGALYTAFGSDVRTEKDDLVVQYADYAHWQRAWLAHGELVRQLEWWKLHLDGAPDVLTLPTDRPRAIVAKHHGDAVVFRVDAPRRARIESIARMLDTTVFTVLLGVYAVLLSKLAGQEEVIIGISTAGRKRIALEPMVGMFVNTLPLRLNVASSQKLSQLLMSISDTVRQALQHQDLPFDHLIQNLEIARSANHMPVFQAMFAYQAEEEKLVLPGVVATTLAVNTRTAKFDLTLNLSPSDEGGFNGAFEFDTDLFDRSTVVRWADHFDHLLMLIVDFLETPIWKLSLLPNEHRRKILLEWNATDVDLTAAHDVIAKFDHHVRSRPTATAVIANEERLTYLELDNRANNLAFRLAKMGATSEVTVAILLPRTADLIVAMLAVLKVGGACLAVDPETPTERVKYMIGNSGAKVLITTRTFGQGFLQSTARTLYVDVPTVNDVEVPNDVSEENTVAFGPRDPDHLAIIVYTSGSTGKPKGVQLTGRALTNVLSYSLAELQLTECNSLLSTSGISFDMFGWEVFSSLYAGSTLVLADRACLFETDYLSSLADENDATYFFGTPSLFRNLFEIGWQPRDKMRLQAGGETLPAHLIEPMLRGGGCYNSYGPAETTMFMSLYPVERTCEAPPPIGHPIWNTQLYVLDNRLELVGIGVTAELFIGGVQLARGYANRPDLTAERFLPNPFAVGGRLYRTGDLVRWRADGELEHLGRADQQVKLRGQRIELGEIEAVLKNHPNVNNVAVVARQDDFGDKQLVAYVVTRDGVLISAKELKTHLALVLPEYMLPAAFVTLDRLPLTLNGKLNVQSLPPPDWIGATEFLAPRDELERQVAQLMAEVLKIPSPISVDLSFFSLGGHSLSAVSICGLGPSSKRRPQKACQSKCADLLPANVRSPRSYVFQQHQTALPFS